ncbi:hypothetical protein N9J36_06170 [Litoricola sp.]|nr:hypothetical protein [Litorivicinus sp.]
MAWSSNTDERYGGGVLAFSAGELDASNLLNEEAVLAEGVVGYGYSTDTYSTADIDVYSLGILSAGTYSLDVDSNTWDFFSLDFGSPSEFGIYDQFGLLVANSFSTFTDVEFSVSNSSTYYAYVKGPIFGTAQYSIVYDEVVTTNSPAIFSNPTYVGTLQAGTSVTASALYIDLDGNTDNIVLTGWFLDDGDISNGYETVLTDYTSYDGSIDLNTDWIGKTLHFNVGFFDDAGNLETSQIWEIGEIKSANNSAQGKPLILGSTVEYQTLTIDVDEIADLDGIGDFSYHWLRSGNVISNATSDHYVLTQDDVGESITVRVTFVDGNGATESVISDSAGEIKPFFDAFKQVVVVVDDFSTWAMEDELIASMTTIYDYAEINYIHSTLGVIDTVYPGYINVDEYGLENVNIGGVDLVKSTGAYQRSESATPNHGDWVLKALCESLDNPNDVEIIALDCDFTTFQDMTYLFANNNYENAYLSAFDDVIEDDTFYFMAGLSASFGGEDISEFLPTISSILNSDSIVVQASPNVSQQGTNWGNVFPNVINVGAWNIDKDGYFLGSEPSQAESIDIYADGFIESSSLGWDSNFGTSFAAPKVMAEILNLYDELILADLNSGNETYDPSDQVDLTPEEETLVTNWFVDEISSEYILSGPNFISNPLAVLDSTIELSGTEPSLIEGFTFGSGQLITNAYSADISPVDISSFNTKVWAIESESLAVVIGTDGADQFDLVNELTNQQTHASVFVGDGDDTITDSYGDDFIMFGSGSDTLNTSSGADLIYKAGSGSLTINASPDGVWSHGYYAKNVGTEFGIGTNNLLSLAGLNRSHDFLFIDGAVDAVTVNLDSGSSSRGAAIFSEDVYSPMNAYIDDVYAYFSANQWSVVDGFTSMYDYDGSGGSFTLNGSDYGDVFDLTTEHYSVTEALPNYSMTYNGLGGDDVIWGFGFATIDGGAGNDVINGGLGANTLTGGSGSDIFEFTATSGNDTITDFNTDEDELHFYFREGEAEESAVASINTGIVTWNAVTVDLGNTSLTISDLNITYEMI